MKHKGEKLDFENAHCEIIPVVAERGYEVRILKDHNPVPWKYSVDFDMATDFRRYVGEDAVDSLIALAKSHILEKRFESLLAAAQIR